MDNRISNLRHATPKLNSLNLKERKDRSSKYIGVHYTNDEDSIFLLLKLLILSLLSSLSLLLLSSYLFF